MNGSRILSRNSWVKFGLLLLALLINYNVVHSRDVSLLASENGQISNDYILGIDWKPDDTMLAVVRRYGGLYLYNNNLEEIGHLSIPAYSPVKWSPDGSKLALVTQYDSVVIEIRDSSSLDLIKVLDPRASEYISMSWSPDGTQLAVGGGEIAEIFDIASGAIVNTLDFQAEPRTHTFVYVEWNPDGEVIATNDPDTSTAIWDASTGQVITTVDPNGAIAWNPDGTLLAIASGDVVILNGSTGEIITTFALGTLGITQLVWKDDTLLSLHPRGSGTYGINVMNTSTEEVINTIDIDESVLAIAMNSNGTFFAYGGAAGILEIIPPPMPPPALQPSRRATCSVSSAPSTPPTRTPTPARSA